MVCQHIPARFEHRLKSAHNMCILQGSAVECDEDLVDVVPRAYSTYFITVSLKSYVR
jgi:hypothetical protein